MLDFEDTMENFLISSSTKKAPANDETAFLCTTHLAKADRIFYGEFRNRCS